VESTSETADWYEKPLPNLAVKATTLHPLETIRSYQGEPKEVVAEWVKGLNRKGGDE
jgi:hypothetical protein